VSIPQRLIELLGDEAVSLDHEELRAHARDLSPIALVRERAGLEPAPPAAVVRPRSTEEVSDLLTWADVERVPIVPFGGGSSVVRGIEPAGGIVLDLSLMDAVIDLDERSRLVRVQAGIRGAALQQSLDARGFMLGHQPQSMALSSVGGWIATGASGQLSLGFGSIEEVVAGFDAVLPGGRVLRGKVAPRRATGPDLGALFIGSEGSLGVVTEAVLRVVPALADRVDLAFTFEHMADGVTACRTIAQGELRPVLLRLYDREDTFIFWRKLEDAPIGPLLVASARDAASLESTARAAEAAGGREAPTELVDYWWGHRNDAVEDYPRTMAGAGILGDHALLETIEVSATWSNLRAVYHSLKERLEPSSDIVGGHLSHLYPDGACLYMTLAARCSDERDAVGRLQAWWGTAMSTVLEHGGSISHHHGIGRTRSPWLREELGEWFEVLVALKGALDPHGIMNPGVLGL
jgi:alkyldihydroxyacetonephosphate synthase